MGKFEKMGFIKASHIFGKEIKSFRLIQFSAKLKLGLSPLRIGEDVYLIYSPFSKA